MVLYFRAFLQIQIQLLEIRFIAPLLSCFIFIHYKKPRDQTASPGVRSYLTSRLDNNKGCVCVPMHMCVCICVCVDFFASTFALFRALFLGGFTPYVGGMVWEMRQQGGGEKNFLSEDTR